MRTDKQPNLRWGLRTVVLGLSEVGSVSGFLKLHTQVWGEDIMVLGWRGKGNSPKIRVMGAEH